jgi:hypothetical protein
VFLLVGGLLIALVAAGAAALGVRRRLRGQGPSDGGGLSAPADASGQA